MSSPEQIVPTQETKEKIVFVSDEVTNALSKAAGGLVGLEVIKLSDQEKENLLSEADSNDLDYSVKHDISKVDPEVLPQRSFVKISSSGDRVTTDTFANNLVELAVGDPEGQNNQEFLDAEKLKTASKLASNREAYYDYKEELEHVQSPRMSEERLRAKMERSKARLDQNMQDYATLQGVDQVINVVNDFETERARDKRESDEREAKNVSRDARLAENLRSLGPR